MPKPKGTIDLARLYAGIDAAIEKLKAEEQHFHQAWVAAHKGDDIVAPKKKAKAVKPLAGQKTFLPQATSENLREVLKKFRLFVQADKSGLMLRELNNWLDDFRDAGVFGDHGERDPRQ